MIELISEGGAFMWPLLVLAAVAMLLIVERFLYFQRVRVNAGDLLSGLANLVKKGKYSEAMHEAARAPGPVPRVAHSALMRHKANRSDLRDIVKEAGLLEVPEIEKNLRGLYAIALLAPLVGMLGTVNGLILSFQGLQGESMSSTQMLYEGFFQSLITTGIGLLIAIPCYLFYTYFISRALNQLRRVERAGIEIVNIICDIRDDVNSDQSE